MIKVIKHLSVLAFMLVVMISVTNAQDISAAQMSAERDLLEAIDRLNTLRSNITEEKIPLARRIAQKETSILDLRNQAAQIQSVNDNNTLALEDIRNDLVQREEENNFLISLLDEYARRFESDLNVSEIESYKTDIDSFNAMDPNLIGEDRISVQLDIIDHGFTRIRRAFDGDTFESEVVGTDGVVNNGSVARFGPLAYFRSADNDLNGLVTSESADIAHVFVDDSGFENLSDLFSGQSAVIPIDVTNGKAISIRNDGDSLFEHIGKGGIWIVPILVFAAVSTIASIVKLLEIYKIKLPEKGSLHKILSNLQKGDQAGASDVAKTVPYPVGDMLQQGINHANDPKELVEEIMYENMLDTQPKLEKYLALIAISAATAPLLGLLGTVTGMINTFQLITLFGTGDAQSLSSGISEALITTEFGLIVAIPALVMHALLGRKVQSIMTDMEKFAVLFVNGLPQNRVS